MPDENSIAVGADKVRTIKQGDWSGATGEKVIIGIIDSGIQYKSKSFQHKNGSSRILFIYDQTQKKNGTLVRDDGAKEVSLTADFVPGSTNFPVGIGVEYEEPVITAAIQNDTDLHHIDKAGHGTMIAGIAASNGFQRDHCDRLYSGIAPKADIIAVKVDEGASQDDVLDAICYLILKAKTLTKALVINLSISFNIDGFHDGSTPLEKRIDHLLQNSPLQKGFSIVTIAGNYRDQAMHVKGTLNPNDNNRTLFILRRNFLVKVFQVWCELKNNNPVEFKVITSRGEDTGQLANPINNHSIPIGEGGGITVKSETAQNASGDRFQIITASMGFPITGKNIEYFEDKDSDFTKQWSLELINVQNNTAIDFHIWSSRDDLKFDGDPKVDENATVTIPGTAKKIITVGGHEFGGGILSLSAKGTTINGEIKPEITAPAKDLISIDNDLPGWCEDKCCCCCDVFHRTDNPGTSLAAPLVSGAIALILDLDPTLTNDQIRQLLFQNIKQDSHTGTNLPNTLWGHGKLDVKKLVETVNNSLSSPRVLNFSAVNSPTLVPETEMAGAEVSLSSSQIKELKNEFLNSAGGKYYYSLAEKHYREVMDLINHNKKVATIWHRNEGPLLLRLFGRLLTRPDKSLPSIVNGRSIIEQLNNIAEIFKRYASKPLASEINKQLPVLLQMQGQSVNQILSFLKSQDRW